MQQNKPNLFDGQKITANEFLNDYWQKKPYLFRQTKLDLSCLPDKSSLFELARTAGVQSRITYSKDLVHFNAIYDEPDAWPIYEPHKPSLLVSDIEKWFPTAKNILQAFPFIKPWRFDDIMMSYAPTGSSVGAHIDYYDVFLIQAKGQRNWQYDNQVLADIELVPDGDLAVIKNFKPEVSKTVNAGDILYLPPQIPHHGISSSDDCMTCSIGMRSPSAYELVSAITDHMHHKFSKSDRFRDAQKTLHSTAQIGDNEINYLKSILTKLSKLSDQELARIFGEFVSGYRMLDEQPSIVSNKIAVLYHKNSFSTFAYYAHNHDHSTLFINGNSYLCHLNFAQQICDQENINKIEIEQSYLQNSDEIKIFNNLIENGDLLPLKINP
ncbi:MAG: hypothetical protein L3J52_06655 [Proteobacteria bacterium]|nr:hypothetical protein [Pseudomonadota bacterium]